MSFSEYSGNPYFTPYPYMIFFLLFLFFLRFMHVFGCIPIKTGKGTVTSIAITTTTTPSITTTKCNHFSWKNLSLRNSKIEISQPYDDYCATINFKFF